MTDKKELEKRVAELEAELKEERAYSKNADRWIDILFDNLEFMLDDMKDVMYIATSMDTCMLRGDNMAAGYYMRKAIDSIFSKVNRWDYDTSKYGLSKLRDDCGYTFVDSKGWVPKGVYDAECEGFEYPDRPREGRDESWHRE